MNAIRSRIGVLTLTAFSIASFGITASAQTDVQADPEHHKLVFENDKVRVVKGTFGPGEKSTAPFDAKEVVIVRIKGTGPITLNLPDGKVITGATMSPGDARWAPGGRIQPENKTKERLEIIVVEPKQ